MHFPHGIFPVSRDPEVGASIGIALATEENEGASSLLRRADAAMYGAKQAGRGRVFLARKPDGDPANTGTSVALGNAAA